MPTQATLII